MRAVPAAILSFIVAGCGPPDGALVIGAAASLSGVVSELTASFSSATDIAATTTLGASGMLAQQIRQGAPIDVFLSADEAWVDTLIATGHVVPHSRAPYARGELALWSRDPSLRITSVEDLRDGRFARIALANPDHAPYGRAAIEALRVAGILDAVQPHLIVAEHVRQSLQFAETGNVDVAFVPVALLPEGGTVLRVPQGLYAPLDQALGIVVRPDSTRARRFVEFVLGPEGRAILERHRLGVPQIP